MKFVLLCIVVFLVSMGIGAWSKTISPSWAKKYSVKWSDEIGTKVSVFEKEEDGPEADKNSPEAVSIYPIDEFCDIVEGRQMRSQYREGPVLISVQ